MLQVTISINIKLHAPKFIWYINVSSSLIWTTQYNNTDKMFRLQCLNNLKGKN